MWLGYTRVSRVGGRGERLISPQMQQQRIEGFAKGRGFAVEMLEPELDVSGAKVERPILGAAIARIESGEAEGIIVATLDRLSRMSITDALRTIERIEGAGGEVIAVAENFDPTTPEGRMVRNIHLSIGEAQRERYAEHIRVAKRQAVERGIWPVHVTPRGYAKGRDRRLIPDPREAPKVRRAFELRAGGASWSQVADVLGSGISGAGKTIRNRVYLGEVRLRVDGELIVRTDAHEALVSRDLWEAAQVAHPRPPRGSGEGALLAGLVRCASCSRQMTPGDGGYRCFPRKASGNCPAPALISARMLEPYVERPALEVLAQMQKAQGRSLSTAAAERGALEEAEANLAAWQEAVRIADVGPELVAAQLRDHAEAVTAARRNLTRALAISGEVAEGLDPVEVYESLSVAGKRHVLGRAIGVVWVWKGRGLGRIKIIAAGYEPQGLSRPGRASPPVAVEWGDLPGEVRALKA